MSVRTPDGWLAFQEGYPDQWERMVALMGRPAWATEAFAAFHVATVMEALRRSVRLTQGRFLNWDSARRQHLVILGSPNLSEWTHLNVLSGNFSFVEQGISNARPQADEPAIFRAVKDPVSGQPLEDYGLIWMSKLPSGSRVLVLAGRAAVVAVDLRTERVAGREILLRGGSNRTARNLLANRGSLQVRQLLPRVDLSPRVPASGVPALDAIGSLVADRSAIDGRAAPSDTRRTFVPTTRSSTCDVVSPSTTSMCDSGAGRRSLMERRL